MNTELFKKSIKCHNAAIKISKEANRIIGQAAISLDVSEQLKLYKQAMDKNQEAFELMVKANDLTNENIILQLEEIAQ